VGEYIEDDHNDDDNDDDENAVRGIETNE